MYDHYLILARCEIFTLKDAIAISILKKLKVIMISLIKNVDFRQDNKMTMVSLLKNFEFGQNFKITVIPLIEKLGSGKNFIMEVEPSTRMILI